MILYDDPIDNQDDYTLPKGWYMVEGIMGYRKLIRSVHVYKPQLPLPYTTWPYYAYESYVYKLVQYKNYECKTVKKVGKGLLFKDTINNDILFIRMGFLLPF